MFYLTRCGTYLNTKSGDGYLELHLEATSPFNLSIRYGTLSDPNNPDKQYYLLDFRIHASNWNWCRVKVMDSDFFLIKPTEEKEESPLSTLLAKMLVTLTEIRHTIKSLDRLSNSDCNEQFGWEGRRFLSSLRKAMGNLNQANAEKQLEVFTPIFRKYLHGLKVLYDRHDPNNSNAVRIEIKY